MKSHPTDPRQEFLRTGILPFAGRATLLADLLAFWRGAADPPGCRAQLLSAPEGGGKTRLLQELEARARAEDALVLRISLRDVGAAGPAPALVERLQALEGPRGPRLETGAGPAGVAAALARLARLRAPLLLLDDAGFLDREGARALAGFLDRLDDEPLPAIVAGRPPLSALRSLLEPRLCAELRLPPLDADAVGRLWRELFSVSAPAGAAELLADECDGLPGALRSVLKALLQPPTRGAPAPPSPLDPRELKSRSTQVLDSLLEGRLQHLGPPLRRALGRGAFLGPVAARESLLAAIGAGGERLLDELVQRGALAPAGGAPVRVAGPAPAGVLLEHADPWAQRRLARRERPRDGALLDALRGRLPLHDAEPWRHLDGLPARPLTEDELDGIAVAGTAAAMRFERSPDPAEGLGIVRRLDARLRRQEGTPSPALRLARSRLLAAELYLDKTAVGQDDFRERAAALVELCGDGEGEAGEFLLLGLLQLNRHQQRLRSDGDAARTSERIEALVSARPDLARSRAWLVHLGDLGLIAWGRRLASLAGRVEGLLKTLLADPGLERVLREDALRRVAPHFMPFFETPAEEFERRGQLEAAERLVHPDDAVLPAVRLQFLLESGRPREFVAAWSPALELWTRRRLRANLYVAWAWQLALRALCGEQLESLDTAFRQMAALKDVPADTTRHLAQCPRFLEILVLTGRSGWVRKRFESRQDPESVVDGQLGWVRLLAELRGGRRIEDCGPLLELPGMDEAPRAMELAEHLRSLAAGALAEEELERLRAWLALPTARLGHLGQLRALTDALDGRGEGRRIAGELVAAWEGAWTWCDERGLAFLLDALLADPPPGPGARILQDWRARARRPSDPGPEALANLPVDLPQPPRVRLRALGELAWQRPGDAEPLRPRGQRQRTLLGLLIADRMLRQPLGRREFGLLASGAAPGEADGRPERVRNVLALAVLRLRERLGADAVLTGDGAPRLNPERVEVDLLEARADLDRAEAELKDGRARVARLAFDRVLDATSGRTPLPGLYHGFFESVRDDFASRRRRVGLELAAALGHHGDAVAEERLLQRMWSAEPDDEDVAARLAGLLETEGRRGEALAVRTAIERARQG